MSDEHLLTTAKYKWDQQQVEPQQRHKHQEQEQHQQQCNGLPKECQMTTAKPNMAATKITTTTTI